MFCEMDFLAAKWGKTEVGDAIIATIGERGHRDSLG
jgi:hypothetical protein